MGMRVVRPKVRDIRSDCHGVRVGIFSLPPLHDAASASSLAVQTRFLRATRLQLGCLVLAAAGGAVGLADGLGEVGAVIGLAAFLAALCARGYLLLNRPARTWYEGRAAAESIKTLAWRYAVGGHPFVTSGPANEAAALFVTRCQEVLRDLTTLDLGGRSSAQITRDDPLDTRQAFR
jgi:hypothetical protein